MIKVAETFLLLLHSKVLLRKIARASQIFRTDINKAIRPVHVQNVALFSFLANIEKDQNSAK